MDIQNLTSVSTVVINSLLMLLKDNHVDVDSVVMQLSNNKEEALSPEVNLGELTQQTLDELQKAKASAPEGFVLIKNDSKTVVAIERMVEQQVEASGMDSRRLERLDGWRIIEAAVEAQESSNEH